MSKSATRAILVLIVLALILFGLHSVPRTVVYVPAYPVANPHPVYDQPSLVPVLQWGILGFLLGRA